MVNIVGNLTTKESRTAWEDAFMANYLNPVLSVSFSKHKFMHDVVIEKIKPGVLPF
jgi:hypothetical protein